jgi:Spy/CpxP family protein refolding chaperone
MKSFIRLRRPLVPVVLALLLAAPAAGQSKWWTSEEYKRELGLTSEQVKRLEEIFQNALPGLMAQKKALDHAEAEFERFLERGSYSDVMEQVDRVETARAELNKSRALMLYEMRRTLTKDQWIRLNALQREAAERERSHPRGDGK